MKNAATQRFLSFARQTRASVSIVAFADERPAQVIANAGVAIGSADGAGGQVRVWNINGVRPELAAQDVLARYLKAPDAFELSRTDGGSWIVLDRSRRRLIFARDISTCGRMYAVHRSGTLFLSTNIHPFLGSVCTEMDLVGRALYQFTGITAGPFALYEGLHAILPGQYFRIDLGTLGVAPDFNAGRTFWKPRAVSCPTRFESAAEQYGTLLLDNLRAHSFRPEVGLFLSGGSDSACVAAALAGKLARPFTAVHLHARGSGSPADSNLASRIAEAMGFPLQIVDPSEQGNDRFEFIVNALRSNASGSYFSFPWYRLMAERLGAAAGGGQTVFNGELCLLDVGFSVQNDRTARNLRRWIYRGAGRRLSKLGPVLPGGTQQLVRHLYGQNTRMAKLVTLLFDVLFSLGRPAHYFSGLKVGYLGFPGISRRLESWLPEIPWPEVEARIAGFLANYGDQLAGPECSSGMAALNCHWYSEASNFTMPNDALDPTKSAMAFPFSSVDLMDFAISLPDAWARDKRIQKEMSHQFLGLPRDVAFFQKDHSFAQPLETVVFSAAERTQMVQYVLDHDFGAMDPRAEKIATQFGKTGEGWYAFSSLFYLAVHERYLQERCTATAPDGGAVI